ncbi:MAG: hypothetical protein J6J43_09560 [Oscillospiraceae bacterium]|nr:hypothetical protein [Oscillospiraceae bacterium]
MTKAELNKAKRNLAILYGLVGVVLLAFLLIFLRFAVKTDNPELSCQTLTEKLEQAEELYVKLEDRPYILPSSPEVAVLFSSMEKTKARPTEEALWITIHFGELYEFYIYEGGLVVGFDGYAATGKKTSAFYQAASDLYEDLRELILADGSPSEENIGFFK